MLRGMVVIGLGLNLLLYLDSNLNRTLKLEARVGLETLIVRIQPLFPKSGLDFEQTDQLVLIFATLLQKLVGPEVKGTPLLESFQGLFLTMSPFFAQSCAFFVPLCYRCTFFGRVGGCFTLPDYLNYQEIGLCVP